MFSPQRYMRLTFTKDRITITKELFGMVESSEYTTRYAPVFISLYEFYNDNKNTTGILIQNDKDCIKFFKEMIDEGSPVPGIVMIFDDHIFIDTSDDSRSIRKMTADDINKDQEFHRIPDVRKLLDRV